MLVWLGIFEKVTCEITTQFALVFSLLSFYNIITCGIMV